MIKRIALPIAIIAVIILIGYGLYWSYNTSQAFERRVTETFLQPYLGLVMAGKEAEAYRAYTSDTYKKRYSLQEYTEHYRQLRAAKGNLASFAYYKDYQSTNVFDGAKELIVYVNTTWGNPPYYKTIMLYLAEQPDGRFLLDNGVSEGKDSFAGPY